MLDRLKITDLEEKVQINLQKHGFTLDKFKDALIVELQDQRRMTLRSRTQECNLEEQIIYIEKRIEDKIDKTFIDKMKKTVELLLRMGGKKHGKLSGKS